MCEQLCWIGDLLMTFLYRSVLLEVCVYVCVCVLVSRVRLFVTL